MTKKELAEKVAKEQNLDVNKLMRLTVAELQKMDAVVPDEAPTEEVEETEEDFDAKVEEEFTQEDVSVVEQASSDVERRFLGYHPITKEPIYL